MSQFQSLFVKCQECMQRPATIKCFQHNTVIRLCYSCDQAASRLTNQPRKTEIIPYQGIHINPNRLEMYVKTNQPQNFKKELLGSDSQKVFQSTGKSSRIEEDPNLYQTQKNNRYEERNDHTNHCEELYPSRSKNEPAAYVSKPKDTNPYKKSPSQPAKKDSLPQSKPASHQSQNRQEYIQPPREDPPKRSTLESSDFKPRQQPVSQPAPEIRQQLRDDIKATRDALEQELSKRSKQTEAKVKQLQQRLNEIGKQIEDAKKQSQQLGKENLTLQQKLKVQEQQARDSLSKQQATYQQQFEELSERLQQKQNELDEMLGEMQNYNFDKEQIQATFEMMNNEIQQKDEIIAQLQEQMEGQGDQDNGYDETDNDNEELQQIHQQIDTKNAELKKLEELIENFKNLYQHMNDEKQVLVEDNEKLQNENEQFRQLFHENLHLFGIDPNQLEDGQEGDGEGGGC